MDYIIRAAEETDGAALAAIYAPYVEKTAITFEYVPPTPEEFARRIRRVREMYPYLLAEREGRVLGYAYAARFHERPACDWAVECSVYIREECRGMGVGRALYAALEQALRLQGVLNMSASIARASEPGDPYVTDGSLRFHRQMGFADVGFFDRCGYKFGRWYHLCWVEKHLGQHPEVPAPVVPFETVREKLKEVYGIL